MIVTLPLGKKFELEQFRTLTTCHTFFSFRYIVFLDEEVSRTFRNKGKKEKDNASGNSCEDKEDWPQVITSWKRNGTQL